MEPLTLATKIGAIALVAALAMPALGSEGRRGAPPARTEIRIAVFGNDSCPKGVGEEIIVCARLPEAERYRIPKRLRDDKKVVRDQSWVARARDIEETARDGRPNSCSAVGSGGQTGCFQKFMRDARAQKAADAAVNSVP